MQWYFDKINSLKSVISDANTKEKSIDECPLTRKDPISEPVDRHNQTPVHAKGRRRMVRVRKRKMKVHQRRKRRRKMAAQYLNTFFRRQKGREVEFRTTLKEKVRLAETFDPKEYVDDYLKDLHQELIPKTIHGKSRPEGLIKEIMEQEKLEAQRKVANRLDIITKEPLVLEGETVKQFEERMKSKERQ